jgi:hypothetical protein
MEYTGLSHSCSAPKSIPIYSVMAGSSFKPAFSLSDYVAARFLFPRSHRPAAVEKYPWPLPWVSGRLLAQLGERPNIFFLAYGGKA